MDYLRPRYMGFGKILKVGVIILKIETINTTAVEAYVYVRHGMISSPFGNGRLKMDIQKDFK